MKKIEIRVESKTELYDILARELPQEHGRNLDALHDVLSTLSEPTELQIYGSELYAAVGDRYGDHFLRMLRDTAEENSNLTVTVL